MATHRDQLVLERAADLLDDLWIAAVRNAQHRFHDHPERVQLLPKLQRLIHSDSPRILRTQLQRRHVGKRPEAWRSQVGGETPPPPLPDELYRPLEGEGSAKLRFASVTRGRGSLWRKDGATKRVAHGMELEVGGARWAVGLGADRPARPLVGGIAAPPAFVCRDRGRMTCTIEWWDSARAWRSLARRRRRVCSPTPYVRRIGCSPTNRGARRWRYFRASTTCSRLRDPSARRRSESPPVSSRPPETLAAFGRARGFLGDAYTARPSTGRVRGRAPSGVGVPHSASRAEDPRPQDARGRAPPAIEWPTRFDRTSSRRAHGDADRRAVGPERDATRASRSPDGERRATLATRATPSHPPQPPAQPTLSRAYGEWARCRMGASAGNLSRRMDGQNKRIPWPGLKTEPTVALFWPALEWRQPHR